MQFNLLIGNTDMHTQMYTRAVFIYAYLQIFSAIQNKRTQESYQNTALYLHTLLFQNS